MRFVVYFAALLLTVSCTTMEAVSPASEEAVSPASEGTLPSSGEPEFAERTKNKDFLPYIEIDTWGLEYNVDGDFDDKYTRILIVPDDTRAGCPEENKNLDGKCARIKPEGSDTPKRNYQSESRNWFLRWLVGRTVSKAFVANFQLNGSETKLSSELFSLSFDSNNTSGETWATAQGLSAVVSPYFKINAGDTLGMQVTLSLSENSESQVSANVVTALTTAATAIAPKSSLITTLSSDRITQAATFLDENVSKLFDRSITETLDTDAQLEAYCKTKGFIAEISLNVPEVSNIRKTKNSDGVGKWFVYLESPVDSVFTKTFVNTKECPKNKKLHTVAVPDFSRLQTGDILEFRVSDDLTIYDYVFSRLEMTDIIKVINDNPTTPEGEEAARSICARIERRIPALGLNSYDTAATLWAVANSDQFNRDASGLLLDNKTCLSAARWNAIEKKPSVEISRHSAE